jgi:hypothetical protein
MTRPFLLLLLSLHMPLILAVEVPEVVKSCLEKNTPKSTSAQAIELRARDRSGYEQVLLANAYWKRFPDNRSRVLMHFKEPLDVRGARFLIIENEPQNDMYIYMPGLLMVHKITSKRISSSILGTDFSYEDFERLHGILTDLKAEQYPDEVLAGRPVYVVNSYPDDDSGYEKISTYIDIETCVALKTDLYERGHQLRKTMTIDPAVIEKAGDIHVPREVLMSDVRDNTETQLIIQKIVTDIPLDDELFDPEQLQQKDVPPVLTD